MKIHMRVAMIILVLIPGICWAEKRYAADSKVEINKAYIQERLVRHAMTYLGTPYVHAGKTKKGVDCSGFIYAVYLETAGKKLSRSTEDLYTSLSPVKGPLLPGDLVFFNTTGGVSHVGMSLGGERIIHAASRGPKTGVITSSLKEKYYATRYLGARRIFEYTAPVFYITLGTSRIGTKLTAPLTVGRPVTLAVAHKRRGTDQVACRLQRLDGKKKKKEVKHIPIEPGKETLITCSFQEPGRWYVSFADEEAGEILRVEVRVERNYDPRR